MKCWTAHPFRLVLMPIFKLSSNPLHWSDSTADNSLSLSSKVWGGQSPAASLTAQIPRFNHRPVYAKLVQDNVAPNRVSPSTSAVPVSILNQPIAARMLPFRWQMVQEVAGGPEGYFEGNTATVGHGRNYYKHRNTKNNFRIYHFIIYFFRSFLEIFYNRAHRNGKERLGSALRQNNIKIRKYVCIYHVWVTVWVRALCTYNWVRGIQHSVWTQYIGICYYWDGTLTYCTKFKLRIMFADFSEGMNAWRGNFMTHWHSPSE